MKKILVRVPRWLGDAVVSTIFLKALKEKNPDATISVLGPAYLAALFQTHPSVDQFLPLPKPYRWQVRQVGSQLKKHEFDALYVLPRSARTALEAWFSGIPKRIGFGGDLRTFLFTQTKPYIRSLNYPRRYLRLIEDQERSADSLTPYFPQQKPSSGPFASNIKKPLLGIAPLSIAPSRTWDEDRFVAVAKVYLKETKGSVVLMGSAKEKSALLRIKEQIQSDDIRVDAGDLSWPELGWLMSQCTSFLCNDSGLMHVASAFQVPTLVVFGASNPDVALPQQPTMQALQDKDLFCVPCLRNHCVRFGDGYNECLNKISVDIVWKKLSESLTHASF